MLGSALAAALVFGAVFPLIDIPLPEAAEVLEVPARLGELIRERRPLPPPQQVAEQRPREQQPLEPPPEQEPQQVAEQPAQPEATPRQPAG
jgi:hypothetical protein